MAINVSSFFAKASPGIPFLLQDTDLRGGLRVVPDANYLKPLNEFAEAIPFPARSPGMLVVTKDTMHIHQLAADGIFEDKGLLGQASSTDLKLGDSFYQDAEGNLQIQQQYSLPSGVSGNPGDLLQLNAALEPVWLPVAANPGTGIRTIVSHTLGTALEGGQSETFALLMGRANFLIDVRLDVAQVLLEGFGTSSYDESNPYSFKSRAGQLSDDGSSLLADGTIRYSRRYSLISNLEAPVGETIYWKMTNQGNLPVAPTVTITYTAIE